MIVSVHIADVGVGATLRLLGTKPDATRVPGLRYAESVFAAPLGDRLLPRPNPRRVGLVAAWEDDRSLDGFLAEHQIARRLEHGWHVRMRPTHVFGAWQAMPGLPVKQEPMDDDEPAVVLTIGRLRFSQALRFLRASAAAEGRALRDPGLLASTGLGRPGGLVATFSIWRSTVAMRSYAAGGPGPEHREAVKEHARQPFHHESAFIRFRPYLSAGVWDGRDPLAGRLGLSGAQQVAGAGARRED
ncbi:MAG TPA: hypothetical protein VGF95_13275 [Solirubrobacteraceae bacterium]